MVIQTNVKAGNYINGVGLVLIKFQLKVGKLIMLILMYMNVQVFLICIHLSSLIGIKLLGGFNVFGKGATVSRVFEMEPHYRIKVKLTFAKIDSWDNEEGSISLDGEKIWARRF